MTIKLLISLPDTWCQCIYWLWNLISPFGVCLRVYKHRMLTHRRQSDKEKKKKTSCEVRVYRLFLFFTDAVPQKKAPQCVGRGGGAGVGGGGEKKSLVVAAHLGIGSGAESRDGGQGAVCVGSPCGRMCERHCIVWNGRGLLGDEGRDQMLSESKHNLSTGNGIKKRDK